MKSIAAEFKAFVLRGNVVDLAVGIIIGVAFAAVVSSLVEDIITPLFGLFGLPNFSTLTINIGAATLRYGEFLNAALAFVLMALTVFLVAVKPVNALTERQRAGTAPEATTRPCPRCLSSIPKAADRCAFCAADISPE